MSPSLSAPQKAPGRAYRWCLVFPFVWQAGLASLVNDIAFRPFGLPFAMVWQLAGIVLTTLVIAWVFKCDAAHGVEAEEAEFLAANAANAAAHP